MSGGSYDYLYYKMEDAARTLMKKHQPDYRRAFGALLSRCASAMHDVEWCDSGDMSEPDDREAIMKCINARDVLNVTAEHAQKLIDELNALLLQARDW